ncbi:MAG: hypothetical protein WCQ45_06065 [bacterium]
MTLMRPRLTGNLVQDLENYMAKERELGVWSYPHFVRYLRAMIYTLTPLPHRCTEAVLDAAAEILAEGRPGALQRFMTTPPTTPGPSRVSREAANAICEVIGCWAGYTPDGVSKLRDEESKYQRAKAAVHKVESAALDVGLTMNDLMACAVTANSDVEIDANRRDAAMAAMSAGHFKLAHEIVTDAPREKN